MKLYLAGPMRGIKEFNFPAFIEAAEALRFNGHEVFNPAERDIEMGFQWQGLLGTTEELAFHSFDLRAALGADLAWITEHADGVVLLPGWANSTGARAEVATARALGLYVYEYIGDGKMQAPPEWVMMPNAASVETRITDPVTGGEKGSKPCQLGAVDPLALWRVGEVAGFGSDKYERFNFLKGYSWGLSYDALQRHLMQFWSGEDHDEESSLPHLAHAAWHCLALLAFMERGRGTDDRPKATPCEN